MRTEQVRTVTSSDGTAIAYDRIGAGPALVLVDGAMSYRGHWGQEQLAEELADRFTVYMYDRRGRGQSGDAAAESGLPYTVQREIEDIEALIEYTGGSAYVYGFSSGAVLALRAAATLGSARVPKLALFEPPFNSGDASPRFMNQAADALAKSVPSARRITLHGLTHAGASEAIAPVLAEFFAG